jgi:hypothetical protein
LPAVVAASPVAVDTRASELEFVVPDVVGLDVGVVPDGVDIGGVTTGCDVGVVDVWVGSVGGVTAVGLRFVVPGVVGLDVGVVPDGVETGGGTTGDVVGVVDVWVGLFGDPTGVEGPVGAVEVGGGGEAGVGVGLGAGAPAVAGTTSNTKAFPLLSTAAQDESEKHETEFRLPSRSSNTGVDQAELLKVM